jgi:hypothetical protein
VIGIFFGFEQVLSNVAMTSDCSCHVVAAAAAAGAVAAVAEVC